MPYMRRLSRGPVRTMFTLKSVETLKTRSRIELKAALCLTTAFSIRSPSDLILWASVMHSPSRFLYREECIAIRGG